MVFDSQKWLIHQYTKGRASNGEIVGERRLLDSCTYRF
jgi:hypothetical protein